MYKSLISGITLTSILLLNPAQADSDFSVDKVYHPYILPLERELEYRFTSQQSDDGNVLLQRFSYGHSISNKVAVQGYLVGARDQDDNFGLEAYELETRWMLTDQGQYWFDWGLLFELEKQHRENAWEFTTGLLTEKEFGRSSVTMNLLLSREWGSDIENENQLEFRFKYRYRWLAQAQPGIEIYSAPDYVGIGPALMGVQRFNGQKQLKWETSFITGLNGNTKDHAFRFLLEYEF